MRQRAAAGAAISALKLCTRGSMLFWFSFGFGLVLV